MIPVQGRAMAVWIFAVWRVSPKVEGDVDVRPGAHAAVPEIEKIVIEKYERMEGAWQDFGCAY